VDLTAAYRSDRKLFTIAVMPPLTIRVDLTRRMYAGAVADSLAPLHSILPVQPTLHQLNELPLGALHLLYASATYVQYVALSFPPSAPTHPLRLGRLILCPVSKIVSRPPGKTPPH
jgi:hypothetical protein